MLPKALTALGKLTSNLVIVLVLWLALGQFGILNDSWTITGVVGRIAGNVVQQKFSATTETAKNTAMNVPVLGGLLRVGGMIVKAAQDKVDEPKPGEIRDSVLWLGKIPAGVQPTFVCTKKYGMSGNQWCGIPVE